MFWQIKAWQQQNIQLSNRIFSSLPSDLPVFLGENLSFFFCKYFMIYRTQILATKNCILSATQIVEFTTELRQEKSVVVLVLCSRYLCRTQSWHRPRGQSRDSSAWIKSPDHENRTISKHTMQARPDPAGMSIFASFPPEWRVQPLYLQEITSL